MTSLVNEVDLGAAWNCLAGKVRRTPVVSLGTCGAGRAPLFAKLETFQYTGSFKARGALSAVTSSLVPPAGVVAASGGNHGAAVAWAARSVGVPATVFVPAAYPSVKLARVVRYGGCLQAVEGSYADAVLGAREFAARTGALFVHAYDDAPVVAGQATAAMELREQLGRVDTVLVACGGGGLYAGTALALAGAARVLPVEPASAPSLHAAVTAGAPKTVAIGGVAVDSLGAPEAGKIATAVALSHGTTPVLVADEDILSARAWLWEEFRLLVEPGAAAAVAPLLTGAVVPVAGETVAVILSGANSSLPVPESRLSPDLEEPDREPT